MTATIIVASKETKATLLETQGTKLSLNQPSVVHVKVFREDVDKIERVGNSAVVTLKDGEVITVDNFFEAAQDKSLNSLTFDDKSGAYWLADFTNQGGVLAFNDYLPLKTLEPLFYHSATASFLPWLWGGLGVAGVAGLAAAAGGGGSSGHSDNNQTSPSSPEIAPVNGTNPIHGTATPGSTIKVTFPNGSTASTVTDTNGQWSIPNPGNLTNGSTITATATDSSGHTSTPSSAIVDTIAPTTPTISSNQPTTDTTPTLTGTAEPKSTVTISIDGAVAGTAITDASGNWSFTPSTPLSEGSHTVTAIATDAAGNNSPVSSGNTIIVDATAPNAPTLSQPGTTSDNTPTLNGTAEPNSTVTVSIDGNVVGTAITDPSGNWSFTPTNTLSDGTHTVTATATDTAGNTSSASTPNTFTIDTAAPSTPVIDPVNGSNPITGTAEPGSTVTVTYPDGSTTTTVADSTGHWTVQTLA